ncbi:MAG: hypothetical protein ABSC63_06580 [Candidatus Binataceae bacterium]|jgi:hypothetical protein
MRVVIMKSNSPDLRIGLNPGLAAMTIALSVIVAGCASQKPLQVQVTQLGPYSHAAKAPDCRMPVLERMPLKNLSQIAIVELWADAKDQPPDVLPALKRKACETGADALVIINSEHQDIKNLLYAASPNESMNDVTAKNGYANPGDYIREAEHTRRIGEAGHNGFYIDAVAIEYNGRDEKQRAGETAPSTVIDSIRLPPPPG